MPHSPHLATALEAARAAADVVRHYYRSNLAITIKADKSPVTEADVETERTIRSVIAAQYPDHGFYGEETGASDMDAEFVWVVDPIDGTKAFVREYPMCHCVAMEGRRWSRKVLAWTNAQRKRSSWTATSWSGTGSASKRGCGGSGSPRSPSTAP